MVCKLKTTNSQHSRQFGDGSWRSSRRLLIFELIVMPLLLLVHIWQPWRWWGEPYTWKLPSRIITAGGVAIVVIGSMIRLRETRVELGLSRSHLKSGWGSMIVFTAISFALVMVMGFGLGDPELSVNRMGWLGRYAGGMVFQQFVLQWFFNNRVYYLVSGTETRRRWVAVVCSTMVFALLHAPNFALVGGVIWSSMFWCWHFRRHGNIVAVMTSHMILGVSTMIMMGQGPMMNLRVGYPAVRYMREYWHWSF